MIISERKNNHLRICLETDVQSDITTGLERYRLINNSLPEKNFSDFSLSTSVFGKKISAPIMISSMTCGTKEGNEINHLLLSVAEEIQIPFAFGSQRIYLESKETTHFENPRLIAPNVPLFANIGAVQLNYGLSRDDCLKAVNMADADALILHLNPLQELIQENGNTNFEGLLLKIEQLCMNFPVPVVIKEVGWGISAENAGKLLDAGVSMIDVAGAGGTSWAKVEANIIGTEKAKRFASAFYDWGIPTAVSISEIHDKFPDAKLIASGGIRNGVEAAKSIRLGAEICAVAIPILKSIYKDGEMGLLTYLQEFILQLKIAMFTSSGIYRI